MYRIEQEIAEQPDVLKTLLDTQRETLRGVAQAIRAAQPAYVCIAARGTSDNAARYAQYILGHHLRMPVMLATPSLHTLYETPPDFSRAVMIGVSQSGQSEDVRQVLADAKASGALTISVTNDAESALAREAHHHIPLCAGQELSVAATKTYTAELMVMAMLSASLAEKEALWEELARVPAWAAETLKYAEPVGGWAERYRYMEHCIVVGRGFNYCTAFEVSLKIKELCYIAGNGYSEADFRHGPIAQVQPGFPVIAIAPSGKTLPLMLDLLGALAERQAECVVFSDDERALNWGRNRVRLPAGMPEWLTPIVAVMPAQVFGMHLALAKGHPVDSPRGLSKVTVTV